MFHNHKKQHKSPADAKSEPPGLVPRAPRFPIQTPVHYRQSGAASWHEGTSVNISRTGILFRGEMELLPKTVVEMRIVFPSEITGDSPANVVCWGPIVRTLSVAAADSRPAIAAAIVRYHFGTD